VLPPPPMMVMMLIVPPPLRLVEVGHRVGDVRLFPRPERQVRGLVAARDADALKEVLQRHEADLFVLFVCRFVLVVCLLL
jgi:hypothetical protein